MPPDDRPPPPESRIRVISLALLIWRDHLLCLEGHDRVKDETFYRPLGGGVEFGETAGAAAVRELREETGMSIEVGAALGASENLFRYQGEPGHEVVFEFICTIAPGHEPGDLGPMTCHEGGATFIARWLPLPEVLAGTHRVYPDGLAERLARWINSL